MSRVVVGVAGGIAAYKTCTLVRRLKEAGHSVRVVPTENALQFIGRTTWAALSGEPVSTSVFDSAAEVSHVALGRTAELVVVAPATADLLARAAAGRADDLLTNVLLTASSPIVMVSAMHTEMWQHPATVANVALLRSRGVIVMNPDSGRLTGADSGLGRMPEPDQIFAVVQSLLTPKVVPAVQSQDLAGLRVVVSAGGTREAIDPVRFIGNHSSGKMGVALARAAALRGAEVTLVAANLGVDVPGSIRVLEVASTADLGEAMLAATPGADLVVMAAAPADFTPASAADTKIKKTKSDGLSLDLVQTQDVLAALVAQGQAKVIIGFAAETATGPELLALGQAKLARKGCDLLVCNDVSSGVFGADENTVTILDSSGIIDQITGSKDLVAHEIINAALAARKRI